MTILADNHIRMYVAIELSFFHQHTVNSTHVLQLTRLKLASIPYEYSCTDINISIGADIDISVMSEIIEKYKAN